ncbi:hypothetical protein JCM10450v2_002250 [Rhodotorula kratochvilovae]
MPTAPHLDFDLQPAGDRLLRRSRTGCLTCRKRKKKCCETYQGGSCLRCIDGGWLCVRPEARAPAGSSRPRAQARAQAAAPAPCSDTRSADAATTASLQQVVAPAAPTPLGLVPPAQPAASTSTAHFLASPPDGSAILATCPTYSPYALDASFGATPSLVFSSTEPSPPDSLDSLCGIDPSLPFGDSSSQWFDPPPSTDFEIPADLAALLASLPPECGVALPDPAVPHFALAAQAPPPPSTDELLLRFYRDSIVPAWSVTYPAVTRETQVRKYLEITLKYAITRQASKVAAAAYIKLLQNSWSDTLWSDPGAACVLPPELACLEVDPHALLDETMRMLTSPQDEVVTLEAQLWALSDIHIALGALDLPSKSHEIALLADTLLQRAMGPTPAINLAHLESYSSFAVHAFAMIDFARALAQRRETFLRFTYGEVGEADVQTAGDGGSHEIWFGLPSSLAIPLVGAANACAAAQAARMRAPLAPLPAELEVRALALVHELEDWRPRFSVFDKDGDRHSVSLAAEMAVQQETWRYTGLLLVHRVVFRLTPQHAVLSSLIDRLVGSLKAIFVLSRRAAQPLLLDWWSALYSTTAFLVGSVASSPDDRAFCRRFITSAGREPALLNMARALDATWEATDATGVCADWYEVAREKGIGLVFF